MELEVVLFLALLARNFTFWQASPVLSQYIDDIKTFFPR
jgi:hypothetical protein